MKKNYYLLFLLICWFVSCSAPQLTQTNITTNISPMPIISSTPGPTIIPSPTYDYWCWEKEKECELAENLGVNIQQIDSFSPNMQWAAIYIIKMAKSLPDKDIGGMRFVKADNSKEWKFESTDMSQDIDSCGTFLMTNFWSLDSRYVYFSPNPSYCSRMVNYSDVGTQVLYRLNLDTGEFVEFLPFNDNLNSTTSRKLDLYSLEFSSDGTYLAYLQTLTNPLVVYVRNLETGGEISYILDNKYYEAGCLTWSAKKHFLFFYAATTTAPGKPLVSSFYRLNMDDGTLKTIVDDQPYFYCIYGGAEMDSDDLLFTKKLDTSSGYNENLYFNPYTEIFEPYPTPTSYPSKTP